MGCKRWMFSMISIPRNPDTWKWFSEDLEARRGILLRPEDIAEESGI
jgi:hypothetical protein